MAKKATQKFDPATYAYPACRMQHQWKFYDGTIDLKAKLAFQVDWCVCGTKRHSIISMRSANYGLPHRPATYVYPDDYQVKGGMSKADKGQLRMRNFFAQLEAKSE